MLQIWRCYVSCEERRARNSFKAYSFDTLCVVIIATLQFSYLSCVFCLPDIMAEKKKKHFLDCIENVWKDKGDVAKKYVISPSTDHRP